jgi:hypothetical protein
VLNRRGICIVLSDLATGAILFLPLVALALVVLVIGWLMGQLVYYVLEKVIRKMGLEAAFRRASVGRAILRSGYTPGGFFAALGKGITYLFTITSALDLLAIPVLSASVKAFLEYLPSLVQGILILVAGFVLADWIGESIEKGSFSTAQSYVIGQLVRIPLYFVSITIALVQMKIDVTILYIFAQAIAWSLAIAIGIAFGWYLKDKISPLFDKMVIHESK